jgi:hypothetical protein
MSRAGPIWTKNQRSPFVSQGRPPTLLRKTKQLMSQGRVLCLKPQLRLEQHSRKGQKKSYQSNHDVLTLGDSFSQTTEMRFSVHTPRYVRSALNNRQQNARPIFASSFGLMRIAVLGSPLKIRL